jgi:hypothetical protein
MNERTALSRAQLAVESEERAISGVLVMLEAGGRQVLLVRLGADGSIHRLGSGSLDRIERDRFIGTTRPEAFRKVAEKITPPLLHWCGQSRSHPALRGEPCELVVAFKRADGEEQMMAWHFGSLSKWPPPEVCEFVDAVIEATQPWYEEQKELLGLRARRAEYEWWQFFTIPPA